MKYLQLSIVLFVIGCTLERIYSLPIEDQKHQTVLLSSKYVQADLPASTNNPDQSVLATVPFTLLDVDEDGNEKSADSPEDYQRRARSFGLGGLGGLGSLGHGFGGLGLGFKGFGGLNGWGLGGLHGSGLGGLNFLFGKHFG